MRWSGNGELFCRVGGRVALNVFLYGLWLGFPNGQFHQVLCHMVYEYMNISSYIFQKGVYEYKNKIQTYNQIV